MKHHHLNNFAWSREGLEYNNKLIIPHGEKWINDVQNMRLSSLIRNDRPWEIRKNRDFKLNLTCILK